MDNQEHQKHQTKKIYLIRVLKPLYSTSPSVLPLVTMTGWMEIFWFMQFLQNSTDQVFSYAYNGSTFKSQHFCTVPSSKTRQNQSGLLKVILLFVLQAVYWQQKGASTSKSLSGTELGLKCPLCCLLEDCSFEVQL